MKEKKSKILITTISVAIISLISIQYYWLDYAYKIENKQFDIAVNESLINITNKLSRKQESNIFISIINEKGSNYFTDKKLSEDFFNKTDTFPNNKKTKIRDIKKEKKYEIEVENFFINSELNKNSRDSSSNRVIILKSDTIQLKENFPNTRKITISRNIDDSLVARKISWVSNDTITSKRLTLKSNGKVIKLNYDSLQSIKENIVDTLISQAFVKNSIEDIIDKYNTKEFSDLIKSELKSKGINTEYTYNIYEDERTSDSLNTPIYKVKLYPNNFFDNNFLALNFPNKTSFIFQQLQIMLLFSILIVISIIFLFYKTLQMYLLQKKIVEVKTDLLNNITHEFKTPISTINIAQSIINENSENEFIKKYNNVIKNEANKLNNLVENLLNTAQYERGIYKLNIENVDIKLLIETIRESVVNVNEDITINLELNSSRSIVKGDTIHLRNVFQNIIDNGIKYNQNKPVINIRTDNINDKLCIYISDNGIGIDKKYFDKIFEPFYRIPTGNIHNVKGQGIGLNYVKNIIESHKGTISVKSEINKGSTFIIGFKNE